MSDNMGVDGNTSDTNGIRAIVRKYIKDTIYDSGKKYPNSVFNTNNAVKTNVDIGDKYEQSLETTHPLDAIKDYRLEAEKKYELEKSSIPAKNPKRKFAKHTGWKGEFEDYVPTDKVKYDRIIKFIKSNPNLLNKDNAKYIANMVCALSDKYGIDPEITAAILSHECNFVFEPRTMNPVKKKFKGVMQVGPSEIRSMYANPKDANNKELSEEAQREAYSRKFYDSDEKRLDQLKKKYPTWEKLYNAIKTDVALGVELGIIVYKAKLTRHKGNTILALKEYCGNQYKLPSSSLTTQNKPIPKKIYPVPDYKA